MNIKNENYQCKGCNSFNVELFSIGKSSVSGYRCNSLEESKNAPLFDISLIFCNDCNLLSQKRFKEADNLLEKLYEEHESTQHNESNPFFNSFAEKLCKDYELDNSKKVLEIGCNCGAFLKILRDKSGAEVLGVEPAKTMEKIWKKRNLDVINDYLNEESAEELTKYGPFDIIYLRHVYEHVDNPLDLIKYLVGLLDNNGSIVIEVPYLPSIIKFNRHENISYSHLHQYSIKSLSAIFSQFKMGLSNFDLVSNDGGSIIAYFKKDIKTDKSLFENNLKQDFKKFLSSGIRLKSLVRSNLTKYDGLNIAGYGAGAKGQHLIHVLELEKFLSNVIDDTPGIKGKYIPGTDIKIEDSDLLVNSDIDIVINLAPTHQKTIRKKVPSHIQLIDFINDGYL